MLQISNNDYNTIISYCKSKLPLEACGLLAGVFDGKAGCVKKVYFLTNMDESSTHFSMNPMEQLKAAKDMRIQGLKLLAVFHSHIDTEAYPSAEDVRLANDETISHMIISLKDSDNSSTGVFIIDDRKNIIMEELKIG